MTFLYSRLESDDSVMFLIVADSSGSSPGRAGFKMAVAADGEMFGSVGGGVMEISLVELARSTVQHPRTKVIEQIHRRDTENASGMICSGRQTVVMTRLTATDVGTVNLIIEGLRQRKRIAFEISNSEFQIVDDTQDSSPIFFSKVSDTEFVYQERLNLRNDLYIIGGGHCALALSAIASRLGFAISIFDDRPELNTIAKNEFADSVTIVDSYENIANHIDPSEDAYVVVMTLGFASDAVVIRRLADLDFKYFGVLGSKAKMATLMRELRDEGIDPEWLGRIRTPIGLPINSRTPEEIAVSIAAEIIGVKNKA